MKIFIDTANLEEIKKAAAMGILDGVTTNPYLLSKEDMPFRELLAEICKVVDGPISAEVVATDSEGMRLYWWPRRGPRLCRRLSGGWMIFPRQEWI